MDPPEARNMLGGHLGCRIKNISGIIIYADCSNIAHQVSIQSCHCCTKIQNCKMYTAPLIYNGRQTMQLCSIQTGWGWSGGAKVLGKLPVPRHPTNLDYSRARAYCSCSRCGWGLFGHFFLSSITSLFFLPLSGRRPI